MKEKYYNLNGNLVFESIEGNKWVEWEENTDGSLLRLIGSLKIDKNIDVTILDAIENRSTESRYKSIAETRDFIKKLPRWDKTKYYSKMTSLGSSGLLDCLTGDIIDPGFEYDLQPLLVIKYNNVLKNEPCAICGQKSLRRIPLGLFLFDHSASTVFRPVCLNCGEKYTPVLEKILSQFYQKKGGAMPLKIQG